MASYYTISPAISTACYWSEDDSKTKQQFKQIDNASDRSKKPNEAAAGKDGRFPLSQKKGRGNQREKSFYRITGVKDTNVEKPPKQPGPSKKSNVEKQKTRKHDVPSPPINGSDESATGGKKLEKKSYSSPDSRNLMEVASTVVLKIRQYCQEGCVRQTQKYVKSFQGVESIKIDADEGQVKVTGTMKVEELVSHLQKKLNREVVLVSPKRTENVSDEGKGLPQNGKHIVAKASGGYGIEVEKVAKVVEEPYQVKNVPDGRDIRVPAVTKSLDKSKAMPKVHVDNLNNLKNGNTVLSCPQHNSKYGSVGDIKMHHLEKEVKVGVKGMHKEENVSGGRDARSHKASKRSKETKLITFGLTCDEDCLEKAHETAVNFEGVELAKIDMSNGLIVVTGAVDQKRLKSYLKEILKREVLEVEIQGNDIPGDRNKVPTNICGVNYGQVNGDMDVVQWSQKLHDAAARCGGDKHKHTGADGVNMKVKEVAAFGNVNGAWRKDKLGEAYPDTNSMYLQNYHVDPLFRWMSPTHLFVSPFSDEVVSCDEQDIYS